MCDKSTSQKQIRALIILFKSLEILSRTGQTKKKQLSRKKQTSEFFCPKINSDRKRFECLT